MTMTRTTITIDEPLLRDLQRIASERGISMATLIREAIAEKVVATHKKPKSLGIAASGYTDTARLSGDMRPEPRSWR